MRTDNKKNKRDIDKSINFIEDLCWLLDSNKNINYSEIIKILSELKENNKNMSSIDASTNDLVGILPQLLTDTTLFSTNKALAQFSLEVLGIEILNWHKRSRNEMIGVIICKVQESKEVSEGISAYVLSNILKNKEQFTKIQKESEATNNQFLWNDAIHMIVGE